MWLASFKQHSAVRGEGGKSASVGLRAPAGRFDAAKGESFDTSDGFFGAVLTALRAGPPFSWGVTSGGSPGGRSLSKDGTRADSAKDFAV